MPAQLSSSPGSVSIASRIGSIARRLLGRCSVVAAGACALSGVAGAQQASEKIVGEVVSRQGAIPLGHSMVTLMGAERQTFTSEDGVFTFSSLVPWKYRVRVTHIGFTPVELDVELRAGEGTRRLRIELDRISIQLAQVKVVGVAICTARGRPEDAVEADFATIVSQLKLNAEQYRVLSDSFPFRYKMEQTIQSMRNDSTRVNGRVETIAYRSDVHGWEYKPGGVIEQTREGKTLMHLPTLRDFASNAFLNNHCFRYAGLDSTKGGVLIHIGFEANAQIRSPDVNGSVYLDTATYQIRRAELELTKIPSGLPDVTGVRATTIFGEISPSIVVIRDVHGITSVRPSGGLAIIAMTEDQHTYGFAWMRGDPSHPSAKP